ncbi:MAG: DUF4105 domain-containing protein [Zavarzinella sp.]|nr:DUF4105 domain-containing protein [Zavarzinella sp.]
MPSATPGTEPPPSGTWKTRLFRPVRWLLKGLGFLGRLLLVTWATLAIYYSNLPWAWSRVALAVVFAAFSVWALWFTRRPRMGWVFVGLFAAVVVWEILIPPSHDRQWRPEVAVLPRAEIDGDRVRITGVRDFTFRSRDDFTVRYIDREVSLAHLTSLDLFISYWWPGPVGHTFVSFNFDNAPPVCISIETRPEVGEEFSPVASLFKQYELIYIVGEERDLVGVRSKFRGEEVYLYRIIAPVEGVRRLFLIYMDRINELADRPEWYHLLKSNCTINIVRYANAAGREGPWDIRHYLNGWADRYLYAAGRVDTSMPFEELRAGSRITDVARDADDAPDFSQRIRASLPGTP